jgi:hypothetical protein
MQQREAFAPTGKGWTMPPPSNKKEFLAALYKNYLVDREAVEAALRGLPDQSSTRSAEVLVRKGLLTRLQAEVLVKGRRPMFGKASKVWLVGGVLGLSLLSLWFLLPGPRTERASIRGPSPEDAPQANQNGPGDGQKVHEVAAHWSSADIGSPRMPGQASTDGITWTLTGGGADIWGFADQFHFTFTPHTGNGALVAQVTDLKRTHDWAKAGVMFRDSIEDNALFAQVVAAPCERVSFQWRSAAGNRAAAVEVRGVAIPVWVKLVRVGDDFSGYYSADGVAWTQIGDSQTVSMSNKALAGLAVTAHDDDQCTSATFTNVSGPKP